VSTTEATVTFEASLSGPDTAALVQAAAATGWLELDGRRRGRPETRDPLARALQRARAHLRGEASGLERITVHTSGVVKVARTGVRVSIPAMLDQLATLPFEVASFGSLHPAWTDGSLEARFTPRTFGDGHVALGWAAAFKGPGHERLVSRQWLDGGPWRLWKGAGDVSLVQFHDLDADADAALAQARRGHAKLGIGPHGGFVPQPFEHELALGGLYDPGTRRMKVVIRGREPEDRELLEWAAARREHTLADGKPVDAVAFVFPDEADATANLVRITRYGHEVWALRAGDELQLA
jgi:hypothetical protein